MRPLILLFVAVPALLLHQGSSTAWLCSTPATQQLVYLDAVFQSPERDAAAVGQSYAAQLKKAYGYTGTSACTAYPTLNDASAARKQLVQTSVGHDAEVTPVQWTYTAPPAPPPGTASAVAVKDTTPPLDTGALTEPWRTQALDEVKASKQWCQMNAQIHAVFDCDCFAKMIFHYRVAHAADYHTPQGGQDTGGWDPRNNIFYAKDFTCTECLSDPRLAHYADSMYRMSMSGQIGSGRLTGALLAAQVKCAQTKFTADLRAHPHIFDIQGAMNRTVSTCSGSQP